MKIFFVFSEMVLVSQDVWILIVPKDNEKAETNIPTE